MIQKEIKASGQSLVLTLRNDGDFAVANELFLDHQYRFCDETIKKAKNSIIDIGGHLGFFSLMTATLNSDVPIHTFEPHSGNYELLKTNLKNNRIRNVTPKQLAVSDSIGQMELQVSQEDLNHSLEKAIEPTGETQTVQTITLEKIFQKNRLSKCDLLKLDCEGSEFKIIYGAPKELFKKIDAIFLEYHDWIEGEDSNKLKSYLESLGYKVQKFPNNKMKELGFLWCTT
ncbi:FkbM family methyltransferase [Candidatus Pacearchaeota archaeon]|nr:FkbM family methyltransferase [Candidatus Pacearchaeota archaeon]